jgi:hypothetical protein
VSRKAAARALSCERSVVNGEWGGGWGRETRKSVTPAPALGPLPPHAHAQVEAAPGERVERGGALGQHDRPPQGGQQDPRRQPDARGDAREVGQRRQRLQPVAVGTGGLPASGLPADLGAALLPEGLAEHHVIRDGQPVEARLVQQPGLLGEVGPAARVLG